MKRRQFVKGMIVFIAAGPEFAAVARQAYAKVADSTKAKGGKPDPYDMGLGDYDPSAHWYGMGIEVDKCIGCNRCVEACKAENDVPEGPYFFRTWVERYSIMANGETDVECISVNPHKPQEESDERGDVLRSFFVPKLCNHCAHPPCTQVCPVGATFQTKDGVVLVDKQRCIGCRYCIQACPYGARFFNHTTNTADKCTFCYHRVVKGLLPACVEVCPTQARIFGDLKSKASRLVRFQRMNKIHVLKPDLNTEPKAFYSELDGAVR